MSDQIKEPMGIPEPTKPVQQAAQQPVDETREILGLLEKLDIKTPKDLENVKVAANQSGRLANMVGELRQELGKRDQKIDQLLQAAQKQVSQNDYYSAPGGNAPVDLENVIKKAIGEYHHENILKPQMQAQAQFNQQMSAVRGDRYYGVLKDALQQRMQDPDTQYELQSGQTTMLDLYRDMKMDFMENTLTRVADGYKNLAGAKSPGSVAAPHMESGTTGNYVPPGTKPETRQKLKEIADKSTGTDSDIDKMFAELFPPDDPFIQSRRSPPPRR